MSYPQKIQKNYFEIIKIKFFLLRILTLLGGIRGRQYPVIRDMLDLQRDDCFLDAGCGEGFFLREFSKNVSFCVGLDVKINRDLSVSDPEKILLIQADIRHLPCKNGSFKRILLSSVIQMVDGDQQLLRECHRVLNEQGVLVLSAPLPFRFIPILMTRKDALLVKFRAAGKGFYSENELKRLLELSRFRVISSEFAPGIIGSYAFETLLFMCDRFNMPLFSPVYSLLLAPFMLLDRLFAPPQKGDSIIIKAEKV